MTAAFRGPARREYESYYSSMRDYRCWLLGPASGHVPNRLASAPITARRALPASLPPACGPTRLLLLAAVAGLWLLSISGCSARPSTPFDLSGAAYVGREACISCHQDQARLHSGSHHDLAMQEASPQTVLADFNNATLEHHGIVNRFYRDGEKFIVHTEGPDGLMSDFEVKYVFGFEPLQQYMVEFPSARQAAQSNSANDTWELPRLQVLRLCWDTQREAWFYLPPPDVEERLEPSDDLHWTGIAQRWNNMCADCHSTNYRKNFDPRPDKDLPAIHRAQGAASYEFAGEYHSTFAEIDVSCEACHGPGSVHLELAEQWFPGWNRQRGYGLANLKRTPEHQIQACAPCHSRRNVVKGGFLAGDDYYDYYSNQLLTEGVYYPDGQVLDEDYVHGSFIQSKMYHKGIQCSDCHDPHSARLKHDGNQVCTSCHQHPAAKYDSVAHHFHAPGSEGAQCVNCHMPATTYMEIDSRRDHSLRIPRPDLSTRLQTPNACTSCHLEIENVSPEKRDKLRLYQDWMEAARDDDQEVIAELERANQWCDEACDRWYGENRRRDDHFGIALAAGQRNDQNAAQLLQHLLSKRGYEAPAIARATALHLLSQIEPELAAAEAAEAINDAHPLVRSTATSALVGSANVTKSVSLLQKALSDPVRSVRTEAVRNLLEYPQDLWRGRTAADFRKALGELEASLEFNNDRAGAHLALGVLAEQQGRNQQAIKHYQTAIAVEPHVTGPRTNLAALLERSLAGRTAPNSTPSPVEAEIARLRKEELPLLQRDARLVPNAAGIQYRLGLALYVDGQKDEALVHLLRAAELEAEQVAYVQAVALLYESLGQWQEAIAWAKRAVNQSGRDPANLRMLDRIQQSASSAQDVSSQ
jgi:tetratricopeptide (TPR) repeat protein